MLPGKLKRHLQTKHPEDEHRGTEYFERLLANKSEMGKVFVNNKSVSEKVQQCSIEIAELIALNTKPYTLAEAIILPACRKIVKTMLGDQAEELISKILVSNNTIQRRIKDLSMDIEATLNDKMKGKNFALQIDESTDISSKAQLLAFIRFVDGESIVNHFSAAKSCPSQLKV